MIHAKHLGLLLAATLLPGCASPQPTTPTVRIGVALYQQSDTFISSISNQLETLAKEISAQENIKLTLSIVDARSSQSTQNNQVEYFFEQNFDVVCINVVDRTAAAVLIEQAKDADVPLVFFNRQPVEADLSLWDQVYYVGSQGAQAGIIQGQQVIEAWNDETLTIDTNGDGILQYVMLEGEPGHQDTLLRTEYAIKTITQNRISTQKLASYAASWQRGQAQAKVDTWIKEFGDEIEVIFANNDDMALGAIDAYQSTEYDLPFIVGVDGTQSALNAIQVGTLQGTVYNDNQAQASALLHLALALANEQAVEEVVELTDGKYVWCEYKSITAANVETFLS